LREVVRQSLTSPIYESWQDNRSAVEALGERVTALEERLPAITRENTKDLSERIDALERKIARLQERLRDLISYYACS
jgi:ubiquinone biosynthesis protein UbiJ